MNKKYLEDREGGIMKGENWYAYGRSQALEVVHLPKIITPDFASTASYCYDADGSYYFTGGLLVVMEFFLKLTSILNIFWRCLIAVWWIGFTTGEARGLEVDTFPTNLGL